MELPSFITSPVPLRSPRIANSAIRSGAVSRRVCACTGMGGTVQAARVYNAEDDVRGELKEMDAYVPIVPYEVLAERLGRDTSDIVKLDANENPYGPSPLVAQALASARYLHIYPDPESGSLRDALSDYTGISRDYLLAGAGADELIDLLFRLVISPGCTIVNLPPTFGMYRFDADVNVARIVNIPRSSEDFSIDVTAIERHFDRCTPAERPRLLFVASPNNPDGSELSDEDLLRLLALPTLVVLDEAYGEFSDNDRISWVPRHDNLVVLRTFSKWAGLAGMRIGYGAFPLPIIKHLWKIKQPYNVSVAAQVAAEVSIRDKEDLLAKVDKMVQARDEFYEQVKRFPWLKPYPSQSNFVLCRVAEGRSAADIKQKLAESGVLIRYYTSAGLSDCIRISMGMEEQMKRLYAALEEL